MAKYEQRDEEECLQTNCLERRNIGCAIRESDGGLRLSRLLEDGASRYKEYTVVVNSRTCVQRFREGPTASTCFRHHLKNSIPDDLNAPHFFFFFER